MASVADTMTWANVAAELKAYLSQSGTLASDALLMLWLGSINNRLDCYLENPFLNDDGSDITYALFPPEIKIAVFEGVRMLRDHTNANATRLGVVSVKTGDLSESYGSSGEASVDLGDIIRAIKGYVWCHKCNVFI